MSAGEGLASKLRIPIGENTISAGVTAAILTFGLTRVFKLKANTRAMATAAAIGMLAPAAISAASGMASGGLPVIESKTVEFRRAFLSAPARTAAPSGPVYNSAAVFVNDLIPA
jgi:hypothetical protein